MDGVPKDGEGSAIYNCLLCDSYALVTLGLLPDRKLARGLKGKKTYDDLLEAFQVQHAKQTVLLLACPTCNVYARQSSASDDTSSDVTRGRKSGGVVDPKDGQGDVVVPDQFATGEFLRDGSECVLCPSLLVVFEEGELPPIYRDEQSVAGARPKWRLVQGVGPAGLELDRSRTGRLHKPSLKPFGIDTRPLKLPSAIAAGDALAQAVREACTYAEAWALCRSEVEASEALKGWGRGGGVAGDGSSRPVLENWVEAKAEMAHPDDDIEAFLSRAEAAGENDGEIEKGQRSKANGKRVVGHFTDAWQLDGFAS